MRALSFRSIFLLFLYLPLALQGREADRSAVSFLENAGQVTDQLNRARKDVLFYGHSGDIGYYLRQDGFSYQLYENNDPGTSAMRIYRVDISWPGMNKAAKVVALDPVNAQDRFYTPHSPQGALARSYGTVKYESIYKGIDLKFYHSDAGFLKYDYIVHPYGDYSQIRISVEGAGRITRNKDGSLKINTPLGAIIEGSPEVWQGKTRIEAAWKIEGNTLSFSIGDYDRSRPLIIDPLAFRWQNVYGSATTSPLTPANDYATAVAADNNGNVFVCGSIEMPFYSNVKKAGVFKKYDQSGVLQFSMIFDSTASFSTAIYSAWPADCSVDGNNDVYLCGTTNMVYNIATSGTYLSTYNGTARCFVMKFDNNGTKIWGTYYGGPGIDLLTRCVTDNGGNVYVCGTTTSATDIASLGAYQGSLNGSTDAFLVKFDAAGTRQWATYYGGSGKDLAQSCTVDGSGDVYLCGKTSSVSDIATPGSFQPAYNGTGGSNGFLAKFSTGGALQWGTYYGNDSTSIESCALDNSGNIYITGNTLSSGLNTAGAFQTAPAGAQEGYLSKFDNSGNRIWSTYYGGSGNEWMSGCTADGNGHIYIAGTTRSASGIATPMAYCDTLKNTESAFIAEFDASGQRLWGSYKKALTMTFSTGSGIFDNRATRCAAGNGYVYLSGNTDFQTTSLNPVSKDAFIEQYRQCLSFTPMMTSSPGNTACDSIILSTSAIIGATYLWQLNGNTVASTANNSYAAWQSGNYGVMVNDSGCYGNSATLSLAITPSPVFQATISDPLCNGAATGAISIGVSGGIPPYTYQWSNGSSSTSISSLMAGTYAVTVTGGNNCSKTDTLTVVQPAPLVLTPALTHVSCYGATTGTAGVIVNGGTPPYTYSWNNGSSGPAVMNLAAGVYSVLVSDSNSCTLSDTFNITEPATALSTILAITDNTCYNDSTGEAVVLASGGIGPYTYTWKYNSYILSDTDRIANVKAGLYILTTSDMNLCQKTDSVIISEPPQALTDICAVTVDSATGKNLIVWEKTGIRNVTLYKIYRESFIAGQYNLVGATTSNMYSTYIDTSSNPQQQSYTYKISALDSCNNEAPLSGFHRTIHLSSNLGTNGEVNLSWNAYEGKPYTTCHIMRSINGAPFAGIAQVSSTSTSYSDLNPPPGPKTYRIDIDLTTSCNPTARTTGYNRISSNIVALDANTGSVRVIPNPTTGSVRITGDVPATIKITDASGRTVLGEWNRSQLSLHMLSTGVYLIRLYDKTGTLYHYEKIIKK